MLVANRVIPVVRKRTGWNGRPVEDSTAAPVEPEIIVIDDILSTEEVKSNDGQDWSNV